MSFIFFDKECGNLNKPIFRNSNAQWVTQGGGYDVEALYWLTYSIERHSEKAFLEQQRKLSTSLCEATKALNPITCPTRDICILYPSQKRMHLWEQTCFRSQSWAKASSLYLGKKGTEPLSCRFWCRLSFPGALKHAKQPRSLHLKGFSQVWTSWWIFSWLHLVNCSSQPSTLHLKGPLWARCSWRLELCFVINNISHWLHLNNFSPSCDNKCLFKCTDLTNDLSHPSWGHTHGLSPVCIRLCSTSRISLPNVFPHPSKSHTCELWAAILFMFV